MEDRSLGPSIGMIQLWRNTIRRDRKCILDLVSRSRAAAEDSLGLLKVLHNTKRETIVLPLTQIQRSIEWSLVPERGRALTEIQMVAVQMMSKRLRRSRQYLQLSTS